MRRRRNTAARKGAETKRRRREELDRILSELRDAVARVTTDPLKEIQEKRLLDLYNLTAKTQEPYLKREALVEGLLELIVPDKKQQLFKSQEEIQAEQMEQQQREELDGIISEFRDAVIS